MFPPLFISHFLGYRRRSAEDYLRWIMQRLDGPVLPDLEGRDDVTIIAVPQVAATCTHYSSCWGGGAMLSVSALTPPGPLVGPADPCVHSNLGSRSVRSVGAMHRVLAKQRPLPQHVRYCDRLPPLFVGMMYH